MKRISVGGIQIEVPTEEPDLAGGLFVPGRGMDNTIENQAARVRLEQLRARAAEVIERERRAATEPRPSRAMRRRAAQASRRSTAQASRG